MTDTLVVIVQVALIVCVADLISGVAHWAQDRFDTRSIPVFNELFIYKANEHHSHPNRSSQYSWLTRNKYALIISIFFIFPAWLCSFLSWQTGLLILVLLFSSEIHIACHRPNNHKNWLVNKLQKIGCIQSNQHHLQHHQNDNTHYCIITNYVNPVVDKIGFFPLLDRIIIKNIRVTS